jgi:hypothetical protein
LLYAPTGGTLAAMRSLPVFASVCVACATPPIDPDEPPPDETGEVETDDGTLTPDGRDPEPTPHHALGVPIDDTPDDDFRIVHPEMAIGYSPHLNAANWVSWRTRPEDFGPAERFPGPFYPETVLPADWYHPDQPDLNGSGYDPATWCGPRSARATTPRTTRPS